MAEDESLVSRRSRRTTAGNRMELALAELALEEPQEPEEDVDFVVEKDEEDIFESDFASTDDEAAQEDVDEGDRVVREEERRERKSARTRVEKAAAAAHARQRVSFNPEATSSQPKPKLPPRPKRRVSLGVAVNAETGEVIEGGAGFSSAKRQSQRRHTVMNTSATVNRMKDAEEKRAAIPKKTKTTTRLPTQDELIARALDTEEGNIMEHRNYLVLEEEKRAKARVVKQAIEGPVLRWISKKEEIKIEIQLPLPPPAPPSTTATNLYGSSYSFVYTSGAGAGGVGSQAYSMPFYTYTPTVAQSSSAKPQEPTASTFAPETVLSSSNGQTPHITQTAQTVASTSSSNIQDCTTPAMGATNPVPPVELQQQQQQLQPQPQTQSVQMQVLPRAPSQALSYFQAQPVLFPYAPTTPAPIIVHRTENVCKNYVVHEISQLIPSKPTWNDTMTAMFGDHVRWDAVRVFTGKGRPLARPVRTCLITGQPAKYCDPRTNVPFANLSAYEVLTRVLGRGYIWCSALGCYVGVNETNRSGPSEGIDGAGSSTRSKTHERIDVDGEGEGGNGEAEAEQQDEPTPKRRKVGAADGRRVATQDSIVYFDGQHS